MFNKKLLLVGAGYVLGGIVSSLYSKRRSADLRKDLEKAREEGKNDFSVFLDNFVSIHKNLLEDIKQSAVVGENKERLEEKKEELLKIVDSYKEEGKVLVDELKLKGKDFMEDASKKLEKVYSEKSKQIDELRGEAPNKINSMKDNLLAKVDDLRENINKDVKKEVTKAKRSKIKKL